MLKPFEWAVLTVEEADLLIAFIEKATSSPGRGKDYDEMEKRGVRKIYASLCEFVSESGHYQNDLKWLDPSDFARDTPSDGY